MKLTPRIVGVALSLSLAGLTGAYQTNVTGTSQWAAAGWTACSGDLRRGRK